MALAIWDLAEARVDFSELAGDVMMDGGLEL